MVNCPEIVVALMAPVVKVLVTVSVVNVPISVISGWLAVMIVPES